MIKTHRPRGYIWTHASAFQQTEEFRDIHYEDCIASTSKAFHPDHDDELSESERAKKRRRVEKLADEFLNGKPLIIHSARPAPESLKTIVASNARGSGRRKIAIPDVDVSYGSNCVWQDVEDDDEIMQRFLSRAKDQQDEATAHDAPVQQDSRDGDHVPAERVPRPQRRRNASSLLAGPSEEALKQAAALRARRNQSPHSDTIPIPPPLSDRPKRLCHRDRPASEPKPSSQWLSRRMSSAVMRDIEADEDSLDELRLSNVETSPSPSKTKKPSKLSQPMRRLVLSRKRSASHDPSSDSDNIVVTPHVEESLSVRRGKPDAQVCVDENSYHTAPEETEIRDDTDLPQDDDHSPEDSQSRLLRSSGFNGSSRTSWNPVNQNQPSTGPDDSIQLLSTSRRTRRTASVANKEPAATYQRSLQRRPKRQIRYKTEEAIANGPSPFIWRKKVTFPSSDEIVVGSNPKPSIGPNEGTSQSAPVTPAAGSAATLPEPEGFYTQLPASEPPGDQEDKTSQKRSRLSETWIGTQAMLWKAQQDLMTSPEKPDQDDEHAGDRIQTNVDQSSQRSDREPLKQLSQEPQPSTQALLDGFGGFSTVKKPWRGGLRESIDSPTALLRGALTNSKQASNAHEDESSLPGNLLEMNSGRRTSGLRFSISSTGSPLRSTQLNRQPASTRPASNRPTEWSSTELATPGSILKKNPATRSSDRPPDTNNDTGASVRGVGQNNNEDSQSCSFSTSVPLPSFQAAQQQSSLPREDSNLDQTIDDLSGFLDQPELDGVLSQV